MVLTLCICVIQSDMQWCHYRFKLSRHKLHDGRGNQDIGMRVRHHSCSDHSNFFTCGSRDCCCPDMLIFEESFEELTVGRDCNLWFMRWNPSLSLSPSLILSNSNLTPTPRVHNFASQFFSSALLLPQRVALNAQCPGSSAGCAKSKIPVNLGGAVTLDALNDGGHETALGEAKSNMAVNGSADAETQLSFSAANISLTGATDYAGLLKGAAPPLLCPSVCFECNAGTASLVKDVCHNWCTALKAESNCPRLTDLPRSSLVNLCLLAHHCIRQLHN